MNNKKLYVYLMDWYWGRLKKETYQCRQKNQFTQGKRMWDVEEAFTSCSGYSIPNYSRWTLTGESTSQPIINKWVGPRSLWLLKNGGASIYWVALTPEFCLGFFFFLEKKLHWSVSFTDFFLLGCEWFITSIVFSSTWIFRDPDLPKATYKVHSWNKRFCLKGSLGLSHLHACKGPFPPSTNNIFY